MKFNNKGQSALEYLMTYGWALVVIVVVVAALVLLVGNPGQSGDTCSGPGANLNITNQELTTTGWQLKASNISGRQINFGQGTTGQVDSNYFLGRNSPLGGALTDYNYIVSLDPLPPGSQTNVAVGALPAGQTYTAGVRYRTDFNVTYYDGDFTRNLSFSCSGTA